MNKRNRLDPDSSVGESVDVSDQSVVVSVCDSVSVGDAVQSDAVQSDAVVCDSTECDTDTVSVVSSPIPSKGTGTRGFLSVWQHGRPWLTYNARLRRMFCKICTEAGFENAFTRGCAELKKHACTKHAGTRGPSGHKAAIDKLASVRSMQQATSIAMKHNEEAIVALMRNVYYLAKKEDASHSLRDLNELVKLQGVSVLKSLQVDKHTTYEHWDSIQDLHEALSEVISEKLYNQLKAADYMSIMIDESTDISVDQNLMVYIRFVLQGVAKTAYFQLAKLPGAATAENITNQLIELFEKEDIQITDNSTKPVLVAIATDGAATMVGKNSGTVKRLRDHVPHLISVHCIAHRLALAAGQAADKVQYMIKFQEKVNALYKYFEFSPKNLRKLENVQQILFESGDVSSAKGRRFVQVFATRWLSFEGSLNALLANYPALVTLLVTDGEGSGVANAKAKGLLKSVACYKFMYVTHFMADAMSQLAQLSRLFQSQNLNFATVNESVTACIESIQSYLKTPGPNMRKFYKIVPAAPEIHDGKGCFMFHEHMLVDNEKQRSEAKSACQQFVTNIVKNLEARFLDKADQGVLAALFTVFNPTCYPSNQEDLDVYGHDEIDMLEQHFECIMPKEAMCANEFDNFKRLVVSNFSKVTHSVAELCKLVITSHSETYPGMAALAAIALTIPVSSVDCERGFSRQNLIKTKLRNCLKDNTLHRLILLSVEGPPIAEFDFVLAMNKWTNAKNRRIFQMY